MHVPTLSRRTALAGALAGAATMAAAAPLARAGMAGLPLRVVNSGTLFPLHIDGGAGRMEGICADVLRLIGVRQNWSVEYEAVPWARAQDMVRQGQADAFFTIPTAARRAYALFTGTPVYSFDRGVLVYHRDHPQRPGIEAAVVNEDLRAFAMATYLGDGWGETAWGAWPHLRWARDIMASIRMVATQNVALLVQARELVHYHARQMRMADVLAYRRVDFIPNSINHFHFGVRKTYPGCAAIVAAFEHEQARIVAEGAMDGIIGGYI